MKAKRKAGSVRVKCLCGEKEIEAALFYTEGGITCKGCGKSYRTVDTNKPHTHKTSRERHGGHSHNAAPAKEKKERKEKGKK